MPLEVRGCGSVCLPQGLPQWPTMKRVVGSTVSVVFSQSLADLQCQLRRNRHISLVEKPMKIGPEKQAVANLVWSSRCKRSDMAGFKRGERVFFRDRTPLAIGLGHSDAECALAEPRGNQKRCTISRCAIFRYARRGLFPLSLGKFGSHCTTFCPDSGSFITG